MLAQGWSVRHQALVKSAMIFAAASWGINFAVIKDSLSEISPLAFASVRGTLAAAILLSVTRLKEGRVSLTRAQWRNVVLLGLVGYAGQQLLFINGMSLTSAGNSSLILGATPVFVAIIASIGREEHVPPGGWIAVLLSLAGVALLVHARTGFLWTLTYLRGDILILASSLCWALFTVFSKPLLSVISPMRLASTAMVCGTPLLVALGVPSLLQQNWLVISSQAWLGLLYSSILAVALGDVIWYSAVRSLGSTKTASYVNLVPVVGVLAAWAILGERITLVQTAGGIMIVTGVSLLEIISERFDSARRRHTRILDGT